MFTGIVQALCPVVEIADETALRRFTIDLGERADGLETGASVAVNGTCLTVTGLDASCARFDVIEESLGLTNLGDVTVGGRVNVERSFRVGDEIGGHVLSGHVTGVVTVDAIESGTNQRDLWFAVEPPWMKYLHHKGFVALDGASLTIAAVDAESRRIKVTLIPETIARTTLGSVEVGDRVNLEVDAQTQSIVETVERVLAERVG